MRSRAAILYQMGLPSPYAESRPLTIAEVEIDPPGEGEVLIRIRAAGLCHSDLSVINGDRPRPVPMALGHEAAGEVVEVGPGVGDLRPGDHVVAAFVPCCGACEACEAGRPSLCEPGLQANTAGTLLSGARRLHTDGQDLHHHLGVSAFAEYATVSRRSLVKVDTTLPFEEAALFGCAVMTGVGAVLNTAQLPEGSRVGIVGLGGVGLAALLGARTRQPNALLALDLSDEKLALARKLGATHTLNAANPDVVEDVKAATKGGVDFAFEMAGSVKAMDLAYRITRRGGTTVSAGLSNPQHLFSIPHVGLVAEERTVKGSYLGSCNPARDIPRFVEMYQSGALPVDKLLSERIELDEINEGFDRLAQGKTVRQVVMV